MTLQRQHVTVVIAARIGQTPIYPRIGQGLLGGTIVSVRQGDSEAAHSQLEALEHVFGAEFDRGELTVENLRPVLWAAHWLKAVRPVAQRASELLTLAAERAFEPGSKAARDCDAVARVMAGVATTEPHCLTALEAARKIRVPADFYAGERQCIGSEVTSTALRADGIRAFFSVPATEVRSVNSDVHADNCPDCAAIPTSPHGCGREGIHQAGQTYDDSPFRLYGFAHEILNALRLIHETTQQVGGIRCYPRVFEALQQASEVLLLVDGEPEPSQEELSILDLGQALINNRGHSNEYELARRLHELGYRLVEGAAQ